ncbi:ComEC/Rec2 family competence protein [Mesorhizobium marinum]|uniref:ComEC/Rec2 family competence protein n=1 Tax=Mesorhizobium marinum TaxID=3228790 RepID=A0ABV3R098_9HYPH
MANFDFVSSDTATVYTSPAKEKRIRDLLWGDRVEVLGVSGAMTEVRARSRARTGFVDTAALGGQALLEFYFIDVGQGDGILIVTPDRRHILIDGGYPRLKQNTGKSAADFVDWKFFEDYASDTIALDAMICSHNDEDHYGGLTDLLDVATAEQRELDCTGITVEQFFHAGLSWWKDAGGRRVLGDTERVGSSSYFVELLGDRASAVAGLSGASPKALQGQWRKFIQAATAARTAAGDPTPFTRLSQMSGALPGFAAGPVSIAVLAPVESPTPAGPGLRKLDTSTSKNTNGHSVLLRVDYGGSRVLLTGDLNKNSQRVLLEAYSGRETAFLSDVAKSCHHGSEDVSFEFLAAMKPAITVISSGDGEGHDHPRPAIVGASGVTGYLTVKDDEILTPLVYSTELARSVSLGDPYKVVSGPAGATATLDGDAFEASTIHFRETKPGALNPESKRRRLGQTYVVAGQIYGLVNVRTDGRRIMSATMNEGDGSWQIKTILARF